VDMDAYDCVFGMSFLRQVNPAFDWRERTMTVLHKGTLLTLHASVDEQRTVLNSTRFEWCSFSALSKRSLSDRAKEEAIMGYVIPESCTVQANHDSEDPLFSGPGGTLPEIKPLLNEFRHVVVTEVPGGLPPVRFDAAGNPIEHCIDVQEGEHPYARPSRPFTPHEDAEIKKYLSDLLAKGWIASSLSPWAAPVLFVRKKVDPVTGEKTWRMCISHVKLNSKTLNRIAYRLPRVADLLVRVGLQSFSVKWICFQGFTRCA
jgi:hypothetical protein